MKDEPFTMLCRILICSSFEWLINEKEVKKIKRVSRPSPKNFKEYIIFRKLRSH